MRIYYAHSMHLYGSPQEVRDIELLESLGFEVVNPSDEEHVLICSRMKSGDHELMNQYKNNNRFFESASDCIMNYFKQVVSTCNALAFRAHINSKIPSGVGAEVMFARDIKLPIIELPNLIDGRYMSIRETKQYLELLGER